LGGSHLSMRPGAGGTKFAYIEVGTVTEFPDSQVLESNRTGQQYIWL
jgi:hypothetical protein